tara:strand:+ start:116 stop:277 length:162 start_codon:yes stop_codon:yes gene_type:complete
MFFLARNVVLNEIRLEVVLPSIFACAGFAESCFKKLSSVRVEKSSRLLLELYS